ncbi:sensor histidine kinase [Pseudonocardia saturnea]
MAGWRGAGPGGTGLRRIGLEAAAVGLPAVVAVMGVPPFTWSVPAALVACALLPLRHLWPPLAVLGVLGGLAGGLGWPPALVALYTLGRRGGTVPRVLPWLVLPVVAAVAPVFATQDLPWQQGLLTVGFVMVNVGAATVMGLLVGTRARLVESLAELDRARESALSARADAARAEERARIGRDIHDAMGHHITLIAVGAAALAASTAEDDTRRAAGQLGTLARRSLREVRTALGLAGGPYRDAEAGADAVVADVGVLVTQWRDAGLAVELVDDGGAVGVGPIVGRAAYRVVQESLTNAARHAPGSAVRVEVECEARSLAVRVANTAAAGAGDVSGRGGAGLAGLAERVGSAGGELTAGPRPDGGFAVSAVFPLEHAPAPVA